MDAEKKPDAAFMGRITAGITHEMKNVLATVRESAGLMEDLMAMSKGGFPHAEKFAKALGAIQTQIDRGVELATRLNRFAHCPDEALREVNLNEHVDLIALLSRRFARQKNIALSVHPADHPVILLTDPLRIQMALFAGIETCLSVLPPDSTIRMRPRKIEPEAAVDFELIGPGSVDFDTASVIASEHWDDLEELMKVLGGRLTAKKNTFWLQFPNDKSI